MTSKLYFTISTVIGSVECATQCVDEVIQYIMFSISICMVFMNETISYLFRCDIFPLSFSIFFRCRVAEFEPSEYILCVLRMPLHTVESVSANREQYPNSDGSAQHTAVEETKQKLLIICQQKCCCH